MPYMISCGRCGKWMEQPEARYWHDRPEYHCVGHKHALCQRCYWLIYEASPDEQIAAQG